MRKSIVLSKLIAFLFSFFLFIAFGRAQKNNFSIGLRIPIQVDFQKEIIKSAPISLQREQKATVLNYGIDAIVQKKIGQKISTYVGVGYFRDKFNFRRFYNHQLLNIGTDSIPLGTSTRNYIYNILRFPIGIIYQMNETQKNLYQVGGEIIFNYSFQKIYNGGKPFPDANNKISDFQFSGNSVIFYATIGIFLNGYSLLELEPYIRIYHTYKKDEVLYEDPSESIKNSFDALGLMIKYSLNLKKK